MLMGKALGFFRGIGQHPFAFLAQRQIDGRGYLFAHRRAPFNLLANRFDGGVRTQEAIGEGFVFPQQPEQEMLSLDVGASELAGFVPSKKYYAARFLSVSFKHTLSPEFARPDDASPLPPGADFNEAVVTKPAESPSKPIPSACRSPGARSDSRAQPIPDCAWPAPMSSRACGAAFRSGQSPCCLFDDPDCRLARRPE